MRRSREVELTLLAALALSITGCRDERADCVDAQNRKIPDTNCQAGGGGYVGAHWIYGGSGGTNSGDTISGGSVTRGGFGGTGGGDAGGE